MHLSTITVCTNAENMHCFNVMPAHPLLSSSIPSFREEYGKLFDFVNAKKLSIKNRGFKEVGHLESSVPFPCIIH